VNDIRIGAGRRAAALQRGIHHYLQILIGRARIEDITLEGSSTPLVQ
jgi:peptidyl-prolyl cis-trans isomerase C